MFTNLFALQFDFGLDLLMMYETFCVDGDVLEHLEKLETNHLN